MSTPIIRHLFFFFIQCLSMILKLTLLTRLAGQQAPGIPLLPSSSTGAVNQACNAVTTAPRPSHARTLEIPTALPIPARQAFFPLSSLSCPRITFYVVQVIL